MHPESRKEDERNSPERSECTSGLAVIRTTSGRDEMNEAEIIG
jgi:hypothetical protein